MSEPYDAELYELTHRGNPGDVDFYLAACREAHSVLELGSGYGRIAIALAEAGHEVVGVELDPGLLDRARENAERVTLQGALEFHQGDMTELDL
ncbi:MAG: class I SAM-dependent methyltransferase, partial [Myxococcales bacterium]|nr:class I SAM-dependent methyltransferase [Myxococcales bacterium]